MKKGLLILVPALLLSLTACDLNSLINVIDDDDDTNESTGDNGHTSSGEDDSLFDKTESLEKLMAYGKDTGFEITTAGSASDSTETTTIILGMKGNVWWQMDDDGTGTAYRLENNVCSMLTYDSNTQTWSVLIADIGETQYADMFASVSDYLYKANDYFANEGFVTDGTGKYAGRDVLKFKYHFAVGTVSLDHDYYVDKDLGITLYNRASTTSDGDVSWARLETTSFKTGNQVTAITVA